MWFFQLTGNNMPQCELCRNEIESISLDLCRHTMVACRYFIEDIKKTHRMNSKSTPEKFYNPLDRTIPFVNAEDDLDFLYEGFKSRRAQMSCGHAVTPMSLTNWCLRLLDEGETRFVCGQTGCRVEWPYAEVRKMALLTPKERQQFEEKMSLNANRDYYDAKTCPGCNSSVARKDESNLSVNCRVCSRNKGRVYEFCWQCLREWRGRRPRGDRCDNDGCTNDALKTLKNCQNINFESVRGVTGCPSIRSCPTCGTLVEHSGKKCKNIICKRCTVEFCFVCLKISTECLKSSSHYEPCSSGVAPKQTSITIWHKN